MIPFPDSKEDYVQMLFTNKTQIYLMPLIVTDSLRDLIPDTLQLSKHIDFTQFGNIAAVSQPGVDTMFDGKLHFNPIFSLNVWIIILLVLILLSLLMAFIQKKSNNNSYFKQVLGQMWNLSTVLLSEPFPKIPKTFSMRALIGSWLLLAVVLLGIIGGIFRENMIRNIPDLVINTWNDLYERKDMQIICIVFSKCHLNSNNNHV